MSRNPKNKNQQLMEKTTKLLFALAGLLKAFTEFYKEYQKKKLQ